MFRFRIRDCRVGIHFSAFVLLAFCNLFAGLQNGGLMLLSVALHEGAHLAMMFSLNRAPDEILISGLGLRIQLPYGGHLSYGDSIKISLAGPLANLLAAVIAVLLGVRELAFINLAIGCVHLLPIEPLDGGLALRAFLSARMGAERGARWSLAVSVTFLFPMLTIGFMLLLRSRYNFSLFLLSVYLLLYLVLKKDLFTG